jgi:arylsulfatase A-like enzyme
MPENREIEVLHGDYGPAFEMGPVSDTAYFDGRIAHRAEKELARLASQDRPFFLAVGFIKPHLPFNAPTRYWELYDRASIQLTPNPFMPQNAPHEALHHWPELRRYAWIPKPPLLLADDLALTLKHGYFAATSYSDAMIGRVLDALDKLDLAQDTIVVLWGDHGWQLGEHGLWCKHSPFENAIHAPLIIRAPGMTKTQRSQGLVEFVDIYPTLVELSGLPKNDGTLDGTSFVPLLRDPGQRGKNAIFTRWKGADSILTRRFLYTQWRDETGNIRAHMLYDHNVDPEENNNVADAPAYKDVVENLGHRLNKHVARMQCVRTVERCSQLQSDVLLAIRDSRRRCRKANVVPPLLAASRLNARTALARHCPRYQAGRRARARNEVLRQLTRLCEMQPSSWASTDAAARVEVGLS